MAMAKSSDAKTPLYERIKREIESRIRTDKWPARFQLPKDESLAAEFSASPLTVQRALRELQTEGMLIRVRGRGTFVVGRRLQCAAFELRDLVEQIQESGGAYGCDIISLGLLSAGDPAAQLLTLDPELPVFHSKIVHKEDGTPLQLEERFVNKIEAPDYLKQDFRRQTTGAYLIASTEVTSVDNAIRAIRPDAEMQDLLQIDASQPCLLIDRRTWRDSTPVTRSRYIYPGDRYRLRSWHEAAPRVFVESRAPLGHAG